MSMDRSTEEQLRELYDEIQHCDVCPQMNGVKSLRLIKAVNTESDVFIISQALAADQLRFSGVNFFTIDGELGSTGCNLEKFLNKFNRTVFPYQEVKLTSGAVIRGADYNLKSVYNTEIAQCYPGPNKNGTGDREPEPNEIGNCVNQKFIIREIELIKPKLLLLMGKAARDSFFQNILHSTFPENLSDHISQIVKNNMIPHYPISDTTAYIMPIQHASGMNRLFPAMLVDDKLTKMIKELVEGSP